MKPPLFLTLWGAGKGPCTSLAPHARILLGAAIFASCLLSRPQTVIGLAVLATTVSLYVRATGIPSRLLSRLFVLGLVMFLPFFLLSPWVRIEGTLSQTHGFVTLEQLLVPWTIVAKGMSTMVVAAAALSTLTPWEFQEGLGRLPLPRHLALLLFQILHQSAVLVEETRRMARAIALRGAAEHWRVRLVAARSLPTAWLPRVLAKADRVASAMELREYGTTLPRANARSFRCRDWVALCLGGACLLAQAAIRMGM